jgi:hypothetical protein
MAQLLYERQSTDAHLNAVRRHMRLCRQVKGGEQYAARIEAYQKDLEERQKITIKAIQDKESASDDVTLYDTDLDNSIRTLHEKCKQFDRDNTGRPVLNQLFTDGKLSTIIYAHVENEPDMADQLLTRLAALGASHPLNEQSPAIKTNIEKCRAALSIYHDAIKLQKAAEAVEEISKSNLRRQYEFNFLDLSKELGKNAANRLFPVISSSSRTSPDEGDNGNSNEAKK